MWEGTRESGCRPSRGGLHEARPLAPDLLAGVFGAVQPFHQKSPRNQETGPERDEFRFPDASAVLDRDLLEAGAGLARGREQVRLEVEPIRGEPEMPKGVLAEPPHPRTHVAHRHAEEERGEPTQDP